MAHSRKGGTDFHQLFRHLRGGTSRAKRTGRARDLGHVYHLLRSRGRICRTPTICSIICGHKSVEIKHRNSIICSTVCRWPRSCGPGGSPRQGGRLPPGSSSDKLKNPSWGGGFSGGWSCSATRSPISGPWPSCPQGPQRSTAARVARHERSRRCLRR